MQEELESFGRPAYAYEPNTDEESDMSNEIVASAPMNKKMEIMLRKEKERLEDEAQFTFKPKIKGEIKKNLYQDGQSDRFNRLYSDAVKRKVQEKSKQPVEPELTFRPSITEKATVRANSRERNGKWVGERLYTIASNKKPSEKSNPDPEAIFTPVISQRAKSIERSSEKSTCDRLYKQGKVLKEKREQIHSGKGASELEQCTFSPNLPRSRSLSATRSSSAEPRFDPKFPDRMYKYDEKSKKKVQQLAQTKLQDELKDATFKPQLVAKNSSRRLSAGSVHERLAATKSKDLSKIAAEAHAENTFKPDRVTKNSRSSSTASLLRSPSTDEFSSVHERLYKVGAIKQKETEQEIQRIMEEMRKQTPFKPTINSSSRHRDYEDEYKTVFERLATGENRLLMDEVLTKIKAEIDLRGCTFQPQLLTQRRPAAKSDEPPVSFKVIVYSDDL